MRSLGRTLSRKRKGRRDLGEAAGAGTSGQSARIEEERQCGLCASVGAAASGRRASSLVTGVNTEVTISGNDRE